MTSIKSSISGPVLTQKFKRVLPLGISSMGSRPWRRRVGTDTGAAWLFGSALQPGVRLVQRSDDGRLVEGELFLRIFLLAFFDGLVHAPEKVTYRFARFFGRHLFISALVIFH